MVVTNPSPSSPPSSHTSTSSPPIHYRQNRRRERPGSRARRTIFRKAALATDLDEGISEARDSSFYIPNHRTGHGSSPILRQNFDQSWMRWKARQAAELETLAGKENIRQLEVERDMMIGEARRREERELGRMKRRIFGGEDDDEDTLCPIKALLPSLFRSLSRDKP